MQIILEAAVRQEKDKNAFPTEFEWFRKITQNELLEMVFSEEHQNDLQ